MKKFQTPHRNGTAEDDDDEDAEDDDEEEAQAGS